MSKISEKSIIRAVVKNNPPASGVLVRYKYHQYLRRRCGGSGTRGGKVPYVRQD